MANEELLKKAVEAFDALSPEQKAAMLEEQRQSWVRGNVGLSRDERGITTPIIPKNTRPTAPVEGLETVGWLWEYAQYRTDDRGYYGYETVITENRPTDHVSPVEKLRNVRELVTRSQAEAIIAAERTESDEAYELGKRDGYSEAAQEIDLKTGGDGEYRYCTDHDPERHTPDPASMIQRIVERFETLNTMESISEIKEWKRRANEAEASNAAKDARIKELEAECDEFADRLNQERKSHESAHNRTKDLEKQLSAAKQDKTLVRINLEHEERYWKDRAEALETQLAALKDAAKSVEDWWLSEGMNHFPGAPYCIFAIRASLEDRP